MNSSKFRLKQQLITKLAETEHLRSNYESLPQNPKEAANILDEWELEWVQQAFVQNLRDNKLPNGGNDDPTNIRKMVEEMAVKELSMKRHLDLVSVTSTNEHGTSKIDVIKHLLLENSTLLGHDHVISFLNYQHFVKDAANYLLLNGSANCIWFLKWFSVELFMKLCSPEHGALVPVTLLLNYIDKKLDFYHYRVEQLELGTRTMLSKEKIRISLAHITALKHLTRDYISFVARLDCKRKKLILY